jgi:(1->4)-alpha-D-glucan 1-alpha-D-glucosylmutase
MTESAKNDAPRATYRLQFHAGFTFDQAAALVPYLAELGVSHVYCSPYLQAATGSTHGYDVVDHSQVNRELGGAAAHQRFVEVLQSRGLKQLVDFVPNHMCIAPHENAWWRDVLENGPSSEYATYFDVDWPDADEKTSQPILLPILDTHYGQVLESSRLRLERRGGAFVLHFESTELPLSPRSMEGVLHQAAEKARSSTLAFLADSFAALPHAGAIDLTSAALRHRNAAVLAELLARLCEERPDVAEAIDAALNALRYDPEALDALLLRQNYRLAHWQTAAQEVDYRRFFDVSTLASLRIEDARVFHDTHALVLDWVRAGQVDGLRIDHIDGLHDPYRYLLRLREAAPKAWIVVEKILAGDEHLPANWPVQGTTGYEFLNLATRTLVDPAGEEAMTACYQDFAGESPSWPQAVYEKKRLALRELFGGDVNRLVGRLAAICHVRRRYRDYTRRDLKAALTELVACMDVYRTYVRAADESVSAEDVKRVEDATERAKAERPEVAPELFDLLRDLLLLRQRGEKEADFVMRFQQLSGPAMAKGYEDTLLYCDNRFVALNDVGGEPRHFSGAAEEFHAWAAETQAHHPRMLLATTTHDTKRSEDVRARQTLLAEIPDAWRAAVARWSQINEQHRTGEFPDRNLEYLYYQTLIGAWPIELDRVQGYLLKATREAKQFTSWAAHHDEYETAVREFAARTFADSAFVRDLEAFVQPLVAPGHVNALAQTLWKLTMPGVPDIYQGQELWDNSLVDPDNRRPVDFDRRRELLSQLAQLSPEQVTSRAEEGLPKLWVIRQALAARQQFPEAFGDQGDYQPLAAQGERAAHVIAYTRGGKVLSVAPRWPLRLRNEWSDTALTLPTGKWTNWLTGDRFETRVTLADLLRRFPVAMLVRD